MKENNETKTVQFLVASLQFLVAVQTRKVQFHNWCYAGLYIRAGSRWTSPASLPDFAGYFHCFTSQDMLRRWTHNCLLFTKLCLLKNLKKTLVMDPKWSRKKPLLTLKALSLSELTLRGSTFSPSPSASSPSPSSSSSSFRPCDAGELTFCIGFIISLRFGGSCGKRKRSHIAIKLFSLSFGNKQINLKSNSGWKSFNLLWMIFNFLVSKHQYFVIAQRLLTHLLAYYLSLSIVLPNNNIINIIYNIIVSNNNIIFSTFYYQ